MPEQTSTPTVITDDLVEAEAQRSQGRAWSTMDTEQRDAARSSVRQRMILAAYPGLLADRDQAHADVGELHRTLGIAKEHAETLRDQAAAAEDARCTLVNENTGLLANIRALNERLTNSDRIQAANLEIINENASLRAELASANQQISQTKAHYQHRTETLASRAHRAEAALRHTQAALGTAVTGRQADTAELEQLTRTIARQVNELDDLRQELAQTRDAGYRRFKAAQAAADQHAAEWARLRSLLAPYDAEETIAVGHLRDYLRRGPGLIEEPTCKCPSGLCRCHAPADPTRDRYAEGYAAAVAVLRDDDRYRDWWQSAQCQPTGPVRQHLADYLATIGPDGPDVEAYRSRDERLAAIVADALRDAAEDYALFSAVRAADIAVQALADRWAFGPGSRCETCGAQLPRATGGTEPVQCHTCFLVDPGADEPEPGSIPQPWRPVIEAAVAWHAGAGGPAGSGGVRNLAEAVDDLLRNWPGVDLSVPAVSIAEVHAESQEPVPDEAAELARELVDERQAYEQALTAASILATALDQLGARIHRDIHPESSYLDIRGDDPQFADTLAGFADYAEEQLAALNHPVVKALAIRPQAEGQEPARGVAAVPAQVDPLGLRDRLAEQPPTTDGDAIAFRDTCATTPALCAIGWHNHPKAGQ